MERGFAKVEKKKKNRKKHTSPQPLQPLHELILNIFNNNPPNTKLTAENIQDALQSDCVYYLEDIWLCLDTNEELKSKLKETRNGRRRFYQLLIMN